MGDDRISAIISLIDDGLDQEKCRRCGCMQKTVKNVAAFLPGLKDWLARLEPAAYT